MKTIWRGAAWRDAEADGGGAVPGSRNMSVVGALTAPNAQVGSSGAPSPAGNLVVLRQSRWLAIDRVPPLCRSSDHAAGGPTGSDTPFRPRFDYSRKYHA